MTRSVQWSIFTAALFAVLGTIIYAAADISAPNPQPQVVLPCKILHIQDGDTVTVQIELRTNVRLIDCWAPETNKAAERSRGLKSKAKLESLVSGKTGLLTVPLGDNLGKSISLGRVLGRLSIDGKDVSAEMVRSGFATKNKEK